TVLVLKYVIKDYPLKTIYFGIANVIANALVMMRWVVPSPSLLGYEHILKPGITPDFSSTVLWVSQNMEEDYTYSLTL
ncbi:hypothetical protein ACJ73_10204, partial [Blastomyces percursus]